MARPISEPKTRFWSKIQKTSGCWLWIGSRNRKGYGTIAGRGREEGPRLAHRLSWEIHNGPIPQGTFIMHGCDNPPCVNPAHLKIGDLLENNRDMFIKRRHAFGTRNGQSRLDPSKVSEIRKLAKDGTPHGKIAEIFSVSRQTVTKIAGEKSWRSHG